MISYSITIHILNIKYTIEISTDSFESSTYKRIVLNHFNVRKQKIIFCEQTFTICLFCMPILQVRVIVKGSIHRDKLHNQHQLAIIYLMLIGYINDTAEIIVNTE